METLKIITMDNIQEPSKHPLFQRLSLGFLCLFALHNESLNHKELKDCCESQHSASAREGKRMEGKGRVSGAGSWTLGWPWGGSPEPHWGRGWSHFSP